MIKKLFLPLVLLTAQSVAASTLLDQFLAMDNIRPAYDKLTDVQKNELKFALEETELFMNEVQKGCGEIVKKHNNAMETLKMILGVKSLKFAVSLGGEDEQEAAGKKDEAVKADMQSNN